MSEQEIVPAHKWPGEDGMVRLLKCVGKDRRSHGGFLWPERGPVVPDAWSREPTCESGGLFGWPWGIGMGDGKEPDCGGAWIVFAAHPDDVVGLGGKAKAVPCPEAGRTSEVVYSGDYAGAISRIIAGQVAWVKHAARGAASATGASGAASATGERGAASATGASGAASATGWSGAASATGARGAASATGARGAASATGWSGAASATGERGAASATGWSGAASATGERGIASATGEFAILKAGPDGICCCTADECWWDVTGGAVFLHRWPDGWRCMTPADLGASEGDRVRLRRGVAIEVVREV